MVTMRFKKDTFLNVLILFLQSWRDDRLQWNVSEYEGLGVLHVPSYGLWQPDLVLINKYFIYSSILFEMINRDE